MKRRWWVIGIVSVGLLALLLMVPTSWMRSSAREQNIRHNLRTLQLALDLYRQTSGGRSPTSIEDMLSASEVKPETILGGTDEAQRYCMHNDNVGAAATRPSEIRGPIFSYIDGESDGAYWVRPNGDVLWEDF